MTCPAPLDSAIETSSAADFRSSSRTPRRRAAATYALLALALAFALAPLSPSVGEARAQGSFVNFESPQSPHALAVEGDRLYVANTPDNRLSVFDLTTEPPTLLVEIPVGLEPVALAPRPGSPDEVWVVGHLSDDVTVVDVGAAVPVATIRVPDEPADIVFTLDGSRAYVTASQANQVVSIDAATRTITRTFDIPMEEPRSMALSPNGKILVIASLESGNRTTVLGAADAPPSDPQVGLIIPDDDPRSPITLPDKDLFIIKTRNDRLINKTVKGVGTLNFALGVNPTNNRVYVANTEALNLVRFEPNLRGHLIDSRVTIVRKSSGSILVDPVDLNPGIDYDVLPNPAARAIALSQPTAVEFDPVSGKIFVAAFGSGRVGVLDAAGAVVSRIEVGAGPRALAFDAVRSRLFVLNRLDNTVTAVDSSTEAVLHTFGIGLEGFDPTPSKIREGRPFLYDANLSGNGTASCASCHVDATADHLSWDLGDLKAPPDPQFPGAKGPMFTQSLRDLGGTEPYHWRGDRPEFTDFAGAFDTLLGAGAELPLADMQKFEDFVFTVKYPPNPIQSEDRTFSTAAVRALDMFVDPAVFGGGLSCRTCHEFPFGERDVIIPGFILNESQDFNPALLLGLFEKTGFDETGFAFLHDGSEPTVQSFLSASPPFPFFTNAEKDDFNELMMEWDTGIAPIVGSRVLMDASNADDAEVISRIDAMISQTFLVHADVVAHGIVLGEPKGAWYDPGIDRFVSNDSSDPPQTMTDLRDLARGGNASLVFTAVPVGSGPRIGVDRDDDGLFDADEAGFSANPVNADTDGDTYLDGVEVAAGSDPNDSGSTPTATSMPTITAATPTTASPWPGFERLVVSGLDIARGAILEVTDSSGVTTEHRIFPIGPNTFSIFESVDQSLGSTWSGLELVVRNRDGGTSAPFTVP